VWNTVSYLVFYRFAGYYAALRGPAFAGMTIFLKKVYSDTTYRIVKFIYFNIPDQKVSGTANGSCSRTVPFHGRGTPGMETGALPSVS
jgi:hypothetical protein